MTDEKKFCSKCKGILCSCGLDYSVSNSANAQMTDDKKPREWTIESFDHPDSNGADTRWIYGPNTDRVKVIEYAAFEKLQEKYLQAKRIANERHDSISALEREVERLKNTYEPVEGPPMTPEEDASFMAKIDDIFKSPDVQEILKEINDKRKQKEERNRKADAYDDLQTKLQAAEAEIERLKTELVNRDYERNMETSALQAERDRLQSEVERLNKIIAKELSENDDLGAEYTYVNVLKAKLQAVEQVLDLAVKQREAADAEIDRQISLRKASESVDEEYRAKLEAAEAEVERLKDDKALAEYVGVAVAKDLQAKLQATEAVAQGLSIAGKQAYEDARRLAEALEFYSNDQNWNYEQGSCHDMQPRGLSQKLWKVLDMGERAREALTPEIRKKYLK